MVWIFFLLNCAAEGASFDHVLRCWLCLFSPLFRFFPLNSVINGKRDRKDGEKVKEKIGKKQVENKERMR